MCYVDIADTLDLTRGGPVSEQVCRYCRKQLHKKYDQPSARTKWLRWPSRWCSPACEAATRKAIADGAAGRVARWRAKQEARK